MVSSAINTVLLIVAIDSEASPIVKRLNLVKNEPSVYEPHHPNAM